MKDGFFYILFFASILHAQTFMEYPEYKSYFHANNVTGSFFLFETSCDTIICYNPTQFDSGFIPASTFKICNSLIALETGVAKDENLVIPWDSIIRSVPEWNADTDMKTAFKNSTVWYYQEIARRIGEKRMTRWIKKLGYGNRNIAGGIDKFWLSGELRITPHEQLDFLKRLHNEKLPLSLRTMRIVKSIMQYEKTDTYTMYAKTGWSMQDSTDIGWWVGFIEKQGHVYYFVNCVQSRTEDNPLFATSRKRIVYDILNSLKIIDKK